MKNVEVSYYCSYVVCVTISNFSFQKRSSGLQRESWSCNFLFSLRTQTFGYAIFVHMAQPTRFFCISLVVSGPTGKGLEQDSISKKTIWILTHFFFWHFQADSYPKVRSSNIFYFIYKNCNIYKMLQLNT